VVAADGRSGPVRVVVVEDDADLAELIVGELGNRGYDPVGVGSAAEALRALAAADADLLLADIQRPEFRGPELLHAALDRRPDLLVVLITASADVDLAVQALRAGAADFVVKPFTLEPLVLTLERALRRRAMRRELAGLRGEAERPGDPALIARSAAMQRTVELAGRAARSQVPVLVTGEPGTGKAVVARWIHDRSRRRDGRFIHVGCEVLHAAIAEVELFGGRGAGLFAEAAGGTILLDEISELPVQVQSRVLRLLEAARRPDARTPRVILSTHRLVDPPWTERDRLHANLAAALDALGVLHLHVPPLRERIDDIPDLVRLFAARARAEQPAVAITDAALRWLAGTDWPGNAAELAEVVERAAALADRDSVGIDDVVALRARRPESVAALMAAAAERRLSLAEIEINYIRRVLVQTGNNATRAAQILGIDRRTLYRKLAGAP
jgi:two-component system response regulator PilR (NtrC family)/two-component system response regulator HydG